MTPAPGRGDKPTTYDTCVAMIPAMKRGGAFARILLYNRNLRPLHTYSGKEKKIFPLHAVFGTQKKTTTKKGKKEEGSELDRGES